MKNKNKCTKSLTELDTQRMNHQVNYQRKDNWVDLNEFHPIGSRFYTPPNNFLDLDNQDVKILRKRIDNGYKKLLNYLEIQNNQSPKITESWMQFYDPHSGRGHNTHNHCRCQIQVKKHQPVFLVDITYPMENQF